MLEPQKYIEKYSKILFRTTWFRCLKVDMLHCLVDRQQVCSGGGPRLQTGPMTGSWVQKLNIP